MYYLNIFLKKDKNYFCIKFIGNKETVDLKIVKIKQHGF